MDSESIRGGPERVEPALRASDDTDRRGIDIRQSPEQCDYACKIMPFGGRHNRRKAGRFSMPPHGIGKSKVAIGGIGGTGRDAGKLIRAEAVNEQESGESMGRRGKIGNKRSRVKAVMIVETDEEIVPDLGNTLSREKETGEKEATEA